MRSSESCTRRLCCFMFTSCDTRRPTHSIIARSISGRSASGYTFEAALRMSLVDERSRMRLGSDWIMRLTSRTHDKPSTCSSISSRYGEANMMTRSRAEVAELG